MLKIQASTFLLILSGLVLPTPSDAKTALPAFSKSDAAIGSRTAADWQTLVERRKELSRQHDVAAWGKLVPDDVLWFDDNGRARTKQQMQEQISTSNPERLISTKLRDFRLMDYGRSVLLLYKNDQVTELNGVRYLQSYHAQETYAFEDGQWRLKVYQETAIPTPGKIVAVNPAILADFEGRYAVGADDVITVKSAGSELLTTEPDLPVDHWKPEGDSTFWDGDNHLQFLRDGSGKVTGLIFYPSGQLIPAERLKP